ncbi:MAG: TetR/AcrR family transcriptional regulator [Spirulinaceae cyanobacterium SM2_1_0]|nr:TetR/AcrR family transcriptional regulator [Spirulinaceae cyanobacterium SM2_1_0]
MSTAAANQTKQQILDVAEELFATHGFTGTTLRAIVGAAGVNLAAVHYHFGSKEELLCAVVKRRAQPVVARQLQCLAELEAVGKPVTVEAILTAFFEPCLQLFYQKASRRTIAAQFMGRCRVEPEPVQTIASAEFSESQAAFLDILQRVLPDQTRSQLLWKFDLLVAVLIRVQTEAGKPGALLRSSEPDDVQQAINQLVRFLTPGMRA